METYLIFTTTRETRNHGTGVVEVEKFYGTTDDPLQHPDKFEWRTAEVQLPENMLNGLHHKEAPVVVHKDTGKILFVALPGHNRSGFYRPLKSEPGEQ